MVANPWPLPTGPERRNHRDPAGSPRPRSPGYEPRRSSSAPGTRRVRDAPELTAGAEAERPNEAAGGATSQLSLAFLSIGAGHRGAKEQAPRDLGRAELLPK